MIDISKIKIGNSLDNDNDALKISPKNEKQNPAQIKLKSEHTLRIKGEKIKGKNVTIIGDFAINYDELKELLKSLKKTLNTGGTIKNKEIRLQGLHVDSVRALLKNDGFGLK